MSVSRFLAARTAAYVRSARVDLLGKGGPAGLRVVYGVALFCRYLVAGTLTIIAWRILGLDIRKMSLHPNRFALLDAAIRRARHEGLWLEFGVYQGDSINFIARRARGVVVGFDSFEGLPALWTISYARGAFTLAGQLPRVEANVRLVKGLFAETLPPFLKEHPDLGVSLLHVDCDLYQSAKDVLLALGPRIHPGTVVVFDEFVTLYPDDESRAFREFLRTYPSSFRYLGCSVTGSVAIEMDPQ